MTWEHLSRTEKKASGPSCTEQDRQKTYEIGKVGEDLVDSALYMYCVYIVCPHGRLHTTTQSDLLSLARTIGSTLISRGVGVIDSKKYDDGQ